jgi:hypothetical protein
VRFGVGNALHFAMRALAHTRASRTVVLTTVRSVVLEKHLGLSSGAVECGRLVNEAFLSEAERAVVLERDGEEPTSPARWPRLGWHEEQSAWRRNPNLSNRIYHIAHVFPLCQIGRCANDCRPPPLRAANVRTAN